MPTYLIRTTIQGRTPAIDEAAVRERLVEAKNAAQAIRHVTKDTITCEVAGAADCVRLGKAGIDVETVAAE